MRHSKPAATTALFLLMFTAVAATATKQPESTPAATQAASDASGAMLRANAPDALVALSRVPSEEFRGKDASLRSCLLGRFERTTPPYLAIGVDDAFARDVLHAYQRYWWQALHEPASRPGAEAQLGQRLADLLGEAAPRGEAAFDAMLDRLGNALREHGFHVQQGRTLPLYDLLLWRTREEREFRVALPEGTEQPVRVYLLDGFVSRGWGSYARCDRGGAAGWAKPEGLYAVRERYPDLDAERFRVSFLGHEAQHFADMKRWPEMEPWVLEYRAKLVELALADETAQATLQRFHESQDDSPDHPHPYANRAGDRRGGRAVGRRDGRIARPASGRRRLAAKRRSRRTD